MKGELNELFKKLNVRLNMLCKEIRELDPEHEMAQGTWYVDTVDVYDVIVRKHVSYPEGPMEVLPHSTLSKEGILEYSGELADKLARKQEAVKAAGAEAKCKDLAEFNRLKEKLGL